MRDNAICELAKKTVEAMQVYGLTPYSAWDEYVRAYVPIIKLHEERGKDDFDRELVTEFVHTAEERFERGDIHLSHYRSLKRAAQRITEMYDTGKLSWTAPVKKSGFRLNEYYEKLVADFISSGFNRKGTSDAKWIARKYFAWLIQDGRPDLKGVGADEVQRFMIYCSGHMRGTGVHNVKLYMKKLYTWLYEHKLSKNRFEGLFDFPVSRESRLFPALKNGEIASILEVIDRRQPKGKRDYAIVMLGVTLGLRAIDIARLKLTDINWEKGEIKLVQAKTGNSLALPLTGDTGEAIQDYILNGRRKTESDVVFLTCSAPFRAFSNGVGIGDMFDSYRKKANLPRDSYDGKGFHALRRTLGRNLITAGVSVYDASPIFGSNNPNSMKKYIALDSEHLKECALDFIGIAVKRGERLA